MTAVAPASCARIGNRYYKTDEEFLYACAEAMREEYKAIVDAGLVLQFDDPCIAEGWDQVNPEPTVADYRKLATTWVEALNHAIHGLPADRIRFHLCWGSWHGPHVTDIPMRDIVEVMLKVNARPIRSRPAMSATSTNGRCGRTSNCPTTRSSCRGSSATRPMSSSIPSWSPSVSCVLPTSSGAERVIASTDCGLGGRVHPQIAWAKLEALAQGAALASKHCGIDARPAVVWSRVRS